MKKIFAVIALCFAQVVCAETWMHVSKSVDGILLSADIDSVSLGRVDGLGGVSVFGVMKYSGKEYLPPFIALISVKECVDSGKGTLYNMFFDNTAQEHTWAMDGKAMFDAQGQFLCGFTKEVLKSRQPNNDTKHERKYFI